MAKYPMRPTETDPRFIRPRWPDKAYMRRTFWMYGRVALIGVFAALCLWALSAIVS
jgi:hypothetical protein